MEANLRQTTKALSPIARFPTHFMDTASTVHSW